MMIALYEDEKTWPGNVPNDVCRQNTCTGNTQLRCPECSEPVTHRAEAASGNRVAHFAHCPEQPTDDCDGSRVGESDTHTAMKHNALSAVERCLGELVATSGTEEKVAAPASDKAYRKTDALIEFHSRDGQLGDALAIEVQYENKRKNIPATTADYIANAGRDISVLWLWEENFDTEPDTADEWLCEIGDETDLRERVRRQMWPPSGTVFAGIPDAPDGSVWQAEREDRWDNRSPVPEWVSVEHSHSEWVTLGRWCVNPAEITPEETRPPATCPATLPPDAVDELAAEYKQRHDWEALFNAELAEDRIERFRDENGLPRVEVPVAIPPEPMETAATKHTLRTNSQSADTPTGAPAPPPTPFEDIQCRNCGVYWYKYDAKYGGEQDHCQQCGAPVDMWWNVETGRIADIPYVPNNELTEGVEVAGVTRADGGKQ